MRVWDTSTIEQKTVIKPTLAKPVRTAVTTCAYGGGGRIIGAGLMDGSIQLWSAAGGGEGRAYLCVFVCVRVQVRTDGCAWGGEQAAW